MMEQADRRLLHLLSNSPHITQAPKDTLHTLLPGGAGYATQQQHIRTLADCGIKEKVELPTTPKKVFLNTFLMLIAWENKLHKLHLFRQTADESTPVLIWWLEAHYRDCLSLPSLCDSISGVMSVWTWKRKEPRSSGNEVEEAENPRGPWEAGGQRPTSAQAGGAKKGRWQHQALSISTLSSQPPWTKRKEMFWASFSGAPSSSPDHPKPINY